MLSGRPFTSEARQDKEHWSHCPTITLKPCQPFLGPDRLVMCMLYCLRIPACFVIVIVVVVVVVVDICLRVVNCGDGC